MGNVDVDSNNKDQFVIASLMIVYRLVKSKVKPATTNEYKQNLMLNIEVIFQIILILVVITP